MNSVSVLLAFISLCISIYITTLVLAYRAKNKEKVIWNNGISKECNTPWSYVDTNFYGARLYICKCEDCLHYCTISYPGIDNRGDGSK